jgi:hypothetical protein
VRYAALVVLLASASVAAQVQSRPTDPPAVTAANESWFQQRAPIDFAGDTYYRAGAAVFFDGNTMVPAGSYNGVPLYVDATVEPYSVVLVPVRRGWMQPYERIRRGGLAGTTASRTPSFPVRAVADGPVPLEAAMAPTQLTSEPVASIGVPARSPEPVATSGANPASATSPAQTPVRPSPRMSSAVRPEGNDGVWIHYQGAKWVSAGPAVPLRPTEFRAVGTYDGFPVFVRNDETKTIYLPTRAGLIAPYRAR